MEKRNKHARVFAARQAPTLEKKGKKKKMAGISRF